MESLSIDRDNSVEVEKTYDGAELEKVLVKVKVEREQTSDDLYQAHYRCVDEGKELRLARYESRAVTSGSDFNVVQTASELLLHKRVIDGIQTFLARNFDYEPDNRPQEDN